VATTTKTILICSVLSATTAAAETTGTIQVAADADTTDVRPPGDVAPAVRPIPRRALIDATEVPLWGGGVRLTGLSGIGALPGVNYGVEVAIHVRRDERFLELALGRWVPQETYVVAVAPQRVELALDVWTVRGGWASKTQPLRAWVLAEVGELAGGPQEMSGMIARMVGAVEKERRWVAAGGGFGVAWPMSDRARLFGTVEVAVPVDRTPMNLMTGAQFQPDPAAARANLGIEVGWR
jgi:hypothetical protein